MTSAQQAIEVAQANVQADRQVSRRCRLMSRRLRLVHGRCRQGPTQRKSQWHANGSPEAEHALRVTRQQVQEAVVTAPFLATPTIFDAAAGHSVHEPEREQRALLESLMPLNLIDVGRF